MTLMKRLFIFMFVSLGLFVLGSRTLEAAYVQDRPAIYQTDFETFEEEQAAAAEFNIQMAAESFVLMKNEGNALPLASSERFISVFGVRSDNIILGGAGSGSGSTVGAKTVQESLEAAGLRMNPRLLRFYSVSNPSTELPVEDLAGLEDSYAMYNDAALIVLSRTGSEFNDAAMYQVPGHKNLLDHYYSLDDNEKDLVNMVGAKFGKVVVIINSAHPIEMAFLEDHPNVDAILWIGHTGTTGIMALGKTLIGEYNPSGKTSDIYPAKFAMDPTWPNFKGNIQSQLVVGEDEEGVERLYTHYVSPGHADNVLAPLNNGTDGIARNDWDYYSYSRVMDKDGKTVVVDGPSGGARYYATLDYEEGIYMGYRWYETAHAEGYFASDARGITAAERLAATPAKHGGDVYYNRLDGVVYPFGYGLSYTTFDVKIKETIHNDAVFTSGDALNTEYGQEIELKIEVKNTGLIAGQKVLQVYYSAPYTVGGIEKSSVALVEFDKTKLLQPGQSEIVSIKFKVQHMASFDHDDKNGDGHQGYELDPGTYVIGVYDSSHDVLDSIDAVVGPDIVHYDKDAETGQPITVKFTGDGTWDGTRSDLDYYDTRRTSLVSETPWTELTRADFDGTFPQAPTKSDLRWTDDALLIMQAQVYYTSFNDLETDPWYVSKADVDALGWKQAANAEGRVDGKTAIQLFDMSGVAFDDPKWDEFLNQLTYDELRGLISSNRFTTPALEAIGKPASSDQDGPAQISGGTFWVCHVNVASTWNKDLVYKQGLFIGNESLFAGTHGWYAPGLNMHRNPAAGRNFEYYSQDGVHNGLIAAHVIKGATDKGVTTYMKHLFLNDQETSRYTVSTFVSEQALREIYGRPWEYAIKIGNATASMAAFNKVGLLSANANYNLYVGLLRDEWGFRYSTVTDMFGWGYSPGATGDMAARTHQTPLGSWNNTFGRNIEGEWDAEKGTVVVTFDEDITNGSRWTKDDETGSSNVAINARNPVSINLINNRNFIDYSVSIEADYTDTTKHGPSAAYKDATTMKDGTVLYEKEDTLESYTQWAAVRNAAKSLLFAQANSNTMANGVGRVTLDPKLIELTQTSAIPAQGVNLAYEELPGAVYKVSKNSYLPAGLILNVDGVLRGTPSEAGTFEVRVEGVVGGYVTNAVTHTISITPNFNVADETFALNVPVSTTFATSAFNVGDRYGSGWFAPRISAIEHRVVNGVLPEGLTLETDGTLSGTPLLDGTFDVIIESMLVLSNGQTIPFITPVTLNVSGLPTYETVNVTFIGNFEGAEDQIVAVKKDGNASPIASLYRPGYAFAGWFSDEVAKTAFDFDVTVSADTSVYAGWVKLGNEEVQALIDTINASIAQINTTLEGSTGDITEIEGLVSGLKTDLGTLNTQLSTVEVDAATKKEVENLNAQVEALEALVNQPAPKQDNSLAVTALVIGIVSVVAVAGLAVLVVLKRK